MAQTHELTKNKLLSPYLFWKILNSIGGSAVFGCLSLLALQMRILWNSWEQWDLPLWDGATYYTSCLSLLHLGKIPLITEAPAFIGYYSIFHLLLPDDQPFWIYFFHRIIATVGVFLLLYFFLRTIVSSAIAWLISFYILTLPTGATNEYVVHYFVLIPLIITYIAALSSSFWVNLYVYIALFMVLFTRPDWPFALPITVVIFSIVDIFKGTFKQFSTKKKFIYVIFTITALAVGLYGSFVTATSERSFLAFGQHYAWGYSERHPNASIDNWLAWSEVMELSFGDAQSNMEAFKNNPGEVVTHIVANLKHYPSVMFYTFKPALSKSKVLIFISIFLLCLLLGYLDKVKFTYNNSPIKQYIKISHKLWILMLISVGQPFIATLLIRPRDIYFVQYIPALCLILAVLMFLMQRITRISIDWSIPLLFVCSIFVVPSFTQQIPNRAVVEIVEALYDQDITGDYGLFGVSAYGFCSYIDFDKCTPFEIYDLPKYQSLEEFLAINNIKVLVINQEVKRNMTEDQLSYMEQISNFPNWKYISLFEASDYEVWRKLN